MMRQGRAARADRPAEVGRYCWWPTQASSYLTGCLEILRIRDALPRRARARRRRADGRADRGHPRLPRRARVVGLAAAGPGRARGARATGTAARATGSRSCWTSTPGSTTASRCCTPARPRRRSWSRSPACRRNGRPPDVDRNTRALLAMAGRDGRRGLDRAAEPRSCARWRSRPRPTARTAWATRSRRSPEPSARQPHGPQVIVDEARRRPGELTLVTLGPLTNLAVAVLIEPELPRLLRRWVLMGGAFRGPATRHRRRVDVHCDPEAAQIALRGVAGGRRRGPLGPRPWRWAST